MATSYAYDTDQGRRARLASIGARLTLTRADRGGDIVMQSARYPRYEGTYERILLKNSAVAAAYLR